MAAGFTRVLAVRPTRPCRKVSAFLERGGEIPGSGLIVFACPAPPSHKGALSPHRWQARWGKRTCEQRLAWRGAGAVCAPGFALVFLARPGPPSEEEALPHRWQARHGKRTSFLASSSRSCNPALIPKTRSPKPETEPLPRDPAGVAHNLESLLSLPISITRHPKPRPHNPESGVVGHHLRHDRHPGSWPLLRTRCSREFCGKFRCAKRNQSIVLRI